MKCWGAPNLFSQYLCIVPAEASYTDWIFHKLNLQHLPAPTEPHVGIVSRKVKRFILNEQELIHTTLKKGLSVELLFLDDWPLYQQIKVSSLIFVYVRVFTNN